MKKTFLRILPLAAALLFATSCDKDENNDIKSENGLLTVPFTVKVETGSKVSKIAYAENNGAFTPSFEEKEVGSLTMTLTSEDLSGTLTLANINGTFSGDLEMTAEQKEQFDEGKIKFVGTIGNTAATFAANTTSLKDLIEECAHQYKTAEFASNATSGIGLTDQNSYLAITWTNKGGATVKFTINGSEKSITLNNDGQGWIAVPGGATVACADLEITSATTTVGKIHNISREFSAVPEGYVDLGVKVDDKSVFWAQNNLEGTYLWENAKTAASNNNAELPKQADFQALANACHWVWQKKDGVSGMYAFKLQGTDQSNYKSPANEFDATYKADGSVPYIFLPAAFRGGDRGIYWSSTPNDDDYACCLYFHSDRVYPGSDGSVGIDYSVRLVRRSN
ncbi:MAG: hypothetical protein IKO99_14610 [Bacteroidales bacterium]|nr:hypothetical protein [Bacteroidales bacterium]